MAPDKKGSSRNRIPIKFPDADDLDDVSAELEADDLEGNDSLAAGDDLPEEPTIDVLTADYLRAGREEPSLPRDTGELGGPLTAELVGTRAELKRVEAEVADLKDRLARRQADFENYRKRLERERAETNDRVVAEIAAKMLPVLDNLKRALETEATLEASESDEFRHFLSGVDLIFKQLSGVLEALGVKPIAAVGARFDPNIHEAVMSEASNEFEPDTVMQEIIRGYRLGDKLIRPALVKVAVKK